MRAKTLGNPALRLRKYPDGEEVLRIPYGTEIGVISWNAEPDWALVSYQDEVGYAMKMYLEQLPEPEPEPAPVPIPVPMSVPAPAPIQEISAPIPAPLENPSYVVLQVRMEQPYFSRGVNNLTELERVINDYAARGYRLHTISTEDKGMMLQSNLVFERI